MMFSNVCLGVNPEFFQYSISLASGTLFNTLAYIAAICVEDVVPVSANLLKSKFPVVNAFVYSVKEFCKLVIPLESALTLSAAVWNVGAKAVNLSLIVTKLSTVLCIPVCRRLLFIPPLPSSSRDSTMATLFASIPIAANCLSNAALATKFGL